MQSLEKMCNQLQKQLSALKIERKKWIEDNQMQMEARLMEERKSRKERTAELNNQLVDIKNKRDMIQKYYMAFYQDASLDVQLNMEYEPLPVDMSLYKKQLANMNRREAADIIVAAAKSNLEFLNQYQEEIEYQIENLEKKADESFSQVKKVQIEEKEKEVFGTRYNSIAKSETLRILAEQAVQIREQFQVADWEEYHYISPEHRASHIIIGEAFSRIDFPSFVDESLNQIPGWIAGEGLKIPVCLPLTGFHMMVNYHVAQASQTKEGIRTLIGNVLRHVPAKSVRVYPIDLETLNGGAFGSLGLLNGPAPAFIAPVPSSREEVYQLLQEIYEEAVRASGLLVGYRDVEEYNEAVPEKEKLSQQLLIIYGCPEGMDHRIRELFQKIYYMSDQCGISIIAIHNSNSEIGSGEARTFYQNMKENAFVIESTQDKQYIRYGEEEALFEWQQGLTMLSKETIEEIKEAYKPIEIKIEEESSESYFDEISHERGNKRLNLAFGINERNKVQRFPFEGMNFAAYVSGSAGCGKSSLLHTLITSMMLHIHPEDMEMWLIDFKMTEFQMYAKNMPPHVKRVVLEASEEVVLDIIDELTSLMERRAKLFGKYGIKDLIKLPEEFRFKHIPLVVVIVDEFATMTQIIRNAPVRGALTYAEKLENLLAKGRALGFRFVFSDQAYEKGIAGLTDKSKNQIASRFAMANVSQEEMRGTLAVPNTFMTEQIQNWMASLPPYYALTSEQEDVPGTLEKRTVVHRNKVIFIPSDKINKIIDELKKRYRPVSSPKQVTDDTYLDKNPLVVDGRRMYTFKEVEPEIVSWDAKQDYMEETMRLYLGRPCALKEHWPVELSQTPGENLLTIIEDYDMTASILLSAMQSACSAKMSVVREPADVTILAYRQDKIYHKYRHRWDKKNCKKDLKDICEAVHRLREKVEKNIIGNELIVCLGMYSLYQEWEELPKKKKSNPLASSASQIYAVEPTLPSASPSPIVSMLKGINMPVEEKFSADEDEWDFTEISFGAEESWNKSVKTLTLDDEMLYNAIEDFEYLLTKGPAKGYHFIAVLSKHSEYKELRWRDKMFRHLIYDNLARDELVDIMGMGRSSRVPAGAVRYVSKKEGYSMRPYLWKGLIINGWTMDEKGLAVEAGDEDEEFI